MEKRLRSSLKSSAEEFFSSAANLGLKSSKPTLKTLIHSIPPSSPLSSALPLALLQSISRSILSFQSLDEHSDSAAKSPPTKRPRRSARYAKPDNQPDSQRRKVRVLEDLRVFAYISRLMVSHPGSVFGSSDLLPAVRELHDNLILFESDPVLPNEVASLCEEWWKAELPGREVLISQTMPFLLSKSLTLKKKVDVHRVYTLRDSFNLFDFEDESIEDLKSLLIRCVISPLYLKTEDGRKFVAFTFGLSLQLLKEVLAMIRSQIPLGRKSTFEAYGDILFRAWKQLQGDLKLEIEDGLLQGLIDGAIHASSGTFAASIRRVLGEIINQRTTEGVEKLLFRLADPVIFRSLQVANSNVRQNALHLLLDLFPLEDPDSTKEEKDMLLDKQFFLLEKLLMDDCPDVRVVAVEGCCRVLHLFWEIIPSSTITKIITKIFDEMSHDSCNEVRLSTLKGVMYLLGNPQTHEILKVLLPRLGKLMLDNVLSVRAAVVDLLLLVRDIQSFQFNKVVSLDVLLGSLVHDQSSVAQQITRLIMPSYFPSRISIEEACNRCVTLMKRSPLAGARFCDFALLEGASVKSLMQLIKVFVGLVLSNDKLDVAQREGLLIASANLCSNLASETCHKTALKVLFAGERLKDLFSAASTRCAQSSVLNIVSIVSPDDAAGLLENSMLLITDCTGLSANVEMQAEVRSAHKLLMCCNAFDDMLEVFTKLLQKAAYRCHVKFDTEVPKKIVSAKKRKNSKSSTTKWKHKSGKQSSRFQDDYQVAVGISWQIKDLFSCEDSRKVMLDSQALELPLLALKAISEVSITQCLHHDYMDTYPVLAYTALALHMTFQNKSINETGKHSSDGTNNSDPSRSVSEILLNQVTDHLLTCAVKLYEAGDSQGISVPESNQEASGAGSNYTKQKQMFKKVKMLTAVLKFIVDSIALGFLANNHEKCLKFTSMYIQHLSSAIKQLFSCKSQPKDASLKETISCMKSSFSYASNLVQLLLQATTKASPPPVEAFYLGNDLLDLITSSELFLGSSYAAGLVTAAKPWLPDLILALAFTSTRHHTQMGSAYSLLSDHIKLHFPSWPLVLAKTELSEISGDETEEERSRTSEQGELPEFRKLMGTMVSLVKRNLNILDAFGLVLLTSSMLALDRKDFVLMLGLLHFVCVKLTGKADREWSGLEMMLDCLPEIYPSIEREIEEQSDEDGRQKLESARDLLQPIWMYHIYETERFTAMEEE